MLECADKSLLGPQTVVCFPEYVATWLVFLNQPDFVFKAASFASATRRVLCCQLFKTLSKVLTSNAKNRFSDAFFRANFQDIAFVYQHTFAKLAREFKVTIVGGSVVLPQPRIECGFLICDRNGPLKNICCVWNAAGKLEFILSKMSPTTPELDFTEGGDLSDIKSIDTVAGRLGIVICGDGWEQKTYRHLDLQNVDAFVILAFVPSDVVWNGPWKGYSGKQEEPDVDSHDINRISEYQAWKKYCLNRVACYQKPGVVFYNRTQLWNFGSHGHPMLIDKNGQLTEYKTHLDGSAIVVVEI